jgi:hypothetical protein
MPTCVHATHALLMAHALYALPHTIRVRGTCAYVVGALRSSAKRLPKFEGLLAFVDGSNAERSARGLQYAAVYSTRYIRQKHRIRYACATAYATHASEACSMQQYTRLVIYVSSYSLYVSSYYWRSWMVVMRKATPEASRHTAMRPSKACISICGLKT